MESIHQGDSSRPNRSRTSSRLSLAASDLQGLAIANDIPPYSGQGLSESLDLSTAQSALNLPGSRVPIPTSNPQAFHQESLLYTGQSENDWAAFEFEQSFREEQPGELPLLQVNAQTQEDIANVQLFSSTQSEEPPYNEGHMWYCDPPLTTGS